MIVRPKQHWLQLIFVWHGSVLPKIYTRLLLNFLLSIAVILMLPWYTSLGIKFTVAPFSIPVWPSLSFWGSETTPAIHATLRLASCGGN